MEVVLKKGMLFPSRTAASDYIRDIAMKQKKRAVIGKKHNGGHNYRMICASPTPCTFFVNVSVSQAADVNGYIISTFDLSHKGCSGSAKPTQRQIASLEVVKAAVSANGALPAKQLIDQTRALSGLECSRRMAYRARDVIVESCNGDYLIGFQRME